MSKQKINMVGGSFYHNISSTGHEPQYIKWVKGTLHAPISIYIDHNIMDIPSKHTKNYGWLSESKTIIPELYEWAKNNIQFLKRHYILVFTHDVSLLKLSNIFASQSVMGKSYIAECDSGIFPKTKLVSMIASNKIMCPEHVYRQKMISKFKNKCDHFGRGFLELSNKIDGLKDYCFSIAMENATYPNMISEKITDCFMTGTIPIYYGIKNIGEFFNIDGIIILDDLFDINQLSFDLYHSKKQSVEENYKIAKNMLHSEDYIYLNYIK